MKQPRALPLAFKLGFAVSFALSIAAGICAALWVQVSSGIARFLVGAGAFVVVAGIVVAAGIPLGVYLDTRNRSDSSG